jgi:hypothetical protein
MFLFLMFALVCLFGIQASSQVYGRFKPLRIPWTVIFVLVLPFPFIFCLFLFLHVHKLLVTDGRTEKKLILCITLFIFVWNHKPICSEEKEKLFSRSISFFFSSLSFSFVKLKRHETGTKSSSPFPSLFPFFCKVWQEQNLQ